MQRMRLTYSKGDELKYTGNLDMMKVWERTFRRADLRIAYSQGFHPQPKIHQALPLPLGFTSENDLLDFWLTSDENSETILKRLASALQPGVTIQKCQPVPLESKPLQTIVTSACYSAHIDPGKMPSDLSNRIKTFLSQNECIRERRGKQYDLMPLVESLQISENDTNVILMTLAARPSATGRPEEVLDALGLSLQNVSIIRTDILLSE